MTSNIHKPAIHRELQAGVASGHVIHNRLKPKPHRFKYNMSWCVLDVDQISTWMKRSKLWKHNGWSLFSIKDKDYINAEAKPIGDKVRNFIQQQGHQPFDGCIYLFTHPRFLGYGFNSVNFYFCYQNGGMKYIISEINNTPWGEKKLYFHDCKSAQQGESGDLVFEFSKQFHISPFVAMDIDYSWKFHVTEQFIQVNMELRQKGVNLLNVILDTKITPYMDNSNQQLPLRHCFQPWKMAVGIYWQAFKLWFKKVPFYSHPDSK